jgi:hypothetical protein
MSSSMSTVTGLVPLALSRIGDLRDDAAKEAALRVLLRTLNEIPVPLDALAEAFERILSLSRTFAERAGRERVFGGACEVIAVSPLTLSRRRELLERALNLALACADVPERVSTATVALDARADLRWGERAAEVLDELLGAAAVLTGEDERGRAVLEIVTSLAKAGETDRALAAVEQLPASGRRALGIARVAFALEREGLAGEGSALFERALAEVGAAPPSPEGALALRGVLSHAVSTGMDLPRGGALAAALDVTDALTEVRSQRAVLEGAIGALPGSALAGEALAAALARIDASLERIADDGLRAELRGRLAVSLAALGETNTCVASLRALVDLGARLRAEGGPSVALPILEILGALADGDFEPGNLERFAASALDVLAPLDEHAGVAALLGGMTRFFASPALAYTTRVALLDRTLAVAQGIAADAARIEVVAHVADALSTAGATERGDALFTGLVSGVGRERARPAHLSRALALVRLGRTADARAEIAAAAAVTLPGSPAVEELAMAMARCGFLGDMLAELERVDPTRQADARARLADSLVEATYLDPHLREIGLSSLLEGTTGPVRDTIACLLDQVRVLEALGDVEEIIARAFARTATHEDRRTAAIFEGQLVSALVERIRCAPRQTASP